MRRVGEYRTSIPHVAAHEPFPSGAKSQCISTFSLLVLPRWTRKHTETAMALFLFSPDKFLNSPRIYFLLWKSSEGGQAGDSSLSHVHMVATADSVKCSGYGAVFQIASLSYLTAGSRVTSPLSPPFPKDIFGYTTIISRKGNLKRSF